MKRRDHGTARHEGGGLGFDSALEVLRGKYAALQRENALLKAQLPDGGQGKAERSSLSMPGPASREEPACGEGAGGAIAAPVAEQSDILTTLYVAGFNLHRAPDGEGVISTVTEILLNLVGVASFSIYLLDGKGSSLMQIADERGHRLDGQSFSLHDGIAGVVAKTGIPFWDHERIHGDFHNPVACVPLRCDDSIVGVIQVKSLLAHRGMLGEQDHELFRLLAETAGTALVSALLRRRFLGQQDGAALAWAEWFRPARARGEVAMEAADVIRDGRQP